MIPNSAHERYIAFLDAMIDDCRVLLKQYRNQIAGYENSLKWGKYEYSTGYVHGLIDGKKEMIAEVEHYYRLLEDEKREEKV